MTGFGGGEDGLDDSHVLDGVFDGNGEVYGRGGGAAEAGAADCAVRAPATGFSMDLRLLARLAPAATDKGAILAPWPEDDRLRVEIARLRAGGEIVVVALPGHEGTWREVGCDRCLRRRDEQWIVEQLGEE